MALPAECTGLAVGPTSRRRRMRPGLVSGQFYTKCSFCIIVTVTISYHILDNYSESVCAVRGWWSM